MEINSSKKMRLLFTATLLLGTFTLSISQSALSTAYPALMRAFNITADTVQWLTTGFMLIMCILIPVSPWLLKNLPFKNIYISVLIIFALGTLLIITASNFSIVLIGRALEAIAVGVLFPSFQSVLLTITPKNERPKIMGIVGLVMGAALAVGPIISGIILNFLNWRGLFIFLLFIIVLVTIASFFFIKSVIPLSTSHLDFISIIFSVGLIGILYFINHVGLSTLPLFIVSIVLIVLFIIRQLTIKQPLLELKIMRNLYFDIGMILTATSYVSLIVITVIYPLYYQNILHKSALISGLALVLPAIFLSLTNLLSGRITTIIGFKKTLLIGMALLTSGWLLLYILQERLTLPLMIILGMIIEGGNAFVMMPATTLGANALPKDLISHGTAITTTMRQILGSLGVMIAMLILTSHVTVAANYGLIFLTFSIIEGGIGTLAFLLKE